MIMQSIQELFISNTYVASSIKDCTNHKVLVIIENCGIFGTTYCFLWKNARKSFQDAFPNLIEISSLGDYDRPIFFLGGGIELFFH